MKQHEIVKQLSKKELRKQLVFSQLLLLFLSFILSLFFFDSLFEWKTLFQWDLREILLLGGTSGLAIVVLEIILVSFVPKRHWDDGGINEAIFREQPILFIFLFTFFVAVCEELLFRGVIQTTFGFVLASILFAVIHVRYLHKPFLFVVVVSVSFYIGWLYLYTDNLLVTIITHFLIDFLLGLVIRFKK